MPTEEAIDSSVQSKWQRLLDLSIEALGAPIALITRLNSAASEILLLSGAKPEWNPGGALPHNLGIFVKAVVESKNELAVEDASLADLWAQTVGKQPGIAAFLGRPILWPSGEVFGTVCVLDK